MNARRGSEGRRLGGGTCPHCGASGSVPADMDSWWCPSCKRQYPTFAFKCHHPDCWNSHSSTTTASTTSHRPRRTSTTDPRRGKRAKDSEPIRRRPTRGRSGPARNQLITAGPPSECKSLELPRTVQPRQRSRVSTVGLGYDLPPASGSSMATAARRLVRRGPGNALAPLAV
jgi:hypothetical protein